MATSSIWTDPTGFSVDGTSAAAGNAATAAGGASVEAGDAAPESVDAAPEFAGAESFMDGPGLACVLLPASSPQGDVTTDPWAPASFAFERWSLPGLIAPPTVASGRGAV